MSINILPVMVLYNHAIEETKTWQTLLAHWPTDSVIFIWDNSATNQQYEQPNIHYRHCPANLGVSAAYNDAAIFARKQGFKYLLLLDQDSHFPDGAQISYKQAAESLNKGEIGCPIIYSGDILISPFKIVNLCPTYWKEGPVHDIPLPAGAFSAINSGMLISTETITTVEAYDNRIKLDWSDIDLFLRLGSDFKLHLIPIIMQHKLSVHEKTTLKSRLFRFKHYCFGARLVANKNRGFLRLAYITGREALKQSVFSFNPSFFIIWFKNFLIKIPV